MNSREHNTPKLKRKKYLPLLHRYAVTFNGVDEYLTLALPNNDLLASPGVGDFYSSGIAIAGIVEFGTVAWNGTTSGKTYANTILISAESGISKSISGLRVGQKYKLKIRYQAGTVGLNIASEQYGSDYFTLPDTFGEWNTTSKVFTAVSTTIWIGCGIEAAILDWVSVKHDQGLDANKDQEMILYSGDANFNNPTTRWVPKDGSSNQTCALSTIDKAEGTGSLLITATGAGDATNNYVMLPPEFLESCIAGKKYTKELSLRLDPASLSYGSNILLNGTFETGVNTDNLSAEINCILSFNDTEAGKTGSYCLKQTNTVAGYGWYKTLPLNKVYKISLRYKSPSAAIAIRANAVPHPTQPTLPISADWSSVTFYTYLTSDYIRFRLNDITSAYYDDVIIQDATPIFVTARLGNKSVVASYISIVPTVFTKCVLNFEATETEQNQQPKLWLSGVGSVYTDKISLTQTYDMWISNKSKIPDRTGIQHIIYSKNGNYGLVGYSLAINAENQFIFTICTLDGVGRVAPIAAKTITSYSNTNILINRSTNSCRFYINGVASSYGDISGVGKLINDVQPFGIGVLSYTPLQQLLGQIATLQIIRFDNIALTDFNPNTYQPGHKITDLGGGVPEVVLHLDPKDGSSVANMLKDYSPKGHTITAVNIDLSNRVVVRN